MDVQQLEEAWALRAGAREARLLAALHVPAALSLLGIVRPGDRLVAFADDFADAFASGFDGCDVAMVDEPLAAAFAAAPLTRLLNHATRTAAGRCSFGTVLLWNVRLGKHCL